MTAQALKFSILGVGAWGLNFRNWAELSALLQGQSLVTEGVTAPKPEIIPANERRRAPLSVKLAVESSWQATQASGIDAADLSCVFVSGLGDTALTDYMCKTLAGENKALSPTKFHNSVHNAAAGYWTISTGCQRAANSIAGFQESGSLTLLEAIVQAHAQMRPQLLTFYDAPVSPVLQSILKNQHAFALSLVIQPWPAQQQPSADLSFNASVVQSACSWPELALDPQLQDCYQHNPAAKVLALAEYIQAADAEKPSLMMPLSSATALQISCE